MLLWIWSAAVLVALALYIRQKYSWFSSRGVKNLTPFPFIGNGIRVFLGLDHFIVDGEKTYDSFPKERFVGRYEFVNPLVIVRDLELIKKIAVKDADRFIDHRSYINKDVDPFFARNLVSLKGDEWRDMRGTLSPAFTSSKIRLMVPFMVEVGDQMITVLKKKIQDSNDGYIDVEMKDLTTRYANDVIATCAFGYKVDSHTDENNEFYTRGKEVTNFKFKKIFIVFAFLLFPKIMKMLKQTLLSKDATKFFREMVLGTMKNREDNNIFRPDMIHLLMEAKKGRLTNDVKGTDEDAGFATVEESTIATKQVHREWTDEDLIAQAVIFYMAGYDTVSTCMSFLVHELAVNPDVQERLYQEIVENEEKNGGKFDYNTVQKMTYLDMVVSEALRLWPPAPLLERQCVQNYNIGKPNADATEDYIVQVGRSVAFPVWSIHRDPQYFPDPLRFDPERFSEQNKHNIKPYSYMPFGLGPRNCIGSRFALCEVKVMVYQLLKNMELSPTSKTKIPAKLSKKELTLRIDGGFWVRMRARN